MLYRMDEGLGSVLDRLRELGLDENTMVIFTSDNGPQMSQNVRRYNARWAGSKGNVHEGGIRVPGGIRWPERIEAGVMDDAMMLSEHEIRAPHPPRLYNLASDPDEERDVAAEEPERAATLARKLETWFEDVERERMAKEQGYPR
jgi:arylsulfatase A-like enzyme